MRPSNNSNGPSVIRTRWLALNFRRVGSRLILTSNLRRCAVVFDEAADPACVALQPTDVRIEVRDKHRTGKDRHGILHPTIPYALYGLLLLRHIDRDALIGELAFGLEIVVRMETKQIPDRGDGDAQRDGRDEGGEVLAEIVHVVCCPGWFI